MKRRIRKDYCPDGPPNPAVFWHRNGFTIIELLVVISIIGLIVAITVPAVMAARDSSRRSMCQNNMRQFGLALHQFESTYGYLPTDFEFFENSRIFAFDRPIQVKLLPYLEQVAAYSAICAKGLSLNDKELQYHIPVFHCPADSSSIGINYRTCAGRTAEFLAGTGNDRSGGGAFTPSSGLQPPTVAQITDGLSMTVAMSERTISRGAGNPYDARRDVWLSDAIRLGFDPKTRTVDEAVGACQAANGNPGSFYFNRCGHNYVNDGLCDTSYNHALVPNSHLADCSLWNPGAPSQDPRTHVALDFRYGVMSARSEHRDRTVNILLMDGSARSINPEIDLEVWRASGSRADGDQSLD